MQGEFIRQFGPMGIAVLFVIIGIIVVVMNLRKGGGPPLIKG